MSTPTSVASVFLCASFLWTLYLTFDVRRRPNPPPKLLQLCLLYHNTPAVFLLISAITAQSVQDTALVWFTATMIFRYLRTLVAIWFQFQYELAVSTADPKITSQDCSVIVPPVGPAGNKFFNEMVIAILVNRPARLIFYTNTDSAAEQVDAALPHILADVQAGSSTYQAEHDLGPIKVMT